MGDPHRYQRTGPRTLLSLFRIRHCHRPGASLAGGLPVTGAAASFPLAERGSPVKSPERRLPVGAEVTGDGVHFRVWAPVRKTVEVVLDRGDTVVLQAEAGLQAEQAGYFSGIAAN